MTTHNLYAWTGTQKCQNVYNYSIDKVINVNIHNKNRNLNFTNN